MVWIVYLTGCKKKEVNEGLRSGRIAQGAEIALLLSIQSYRDAVKYGYAGWKDEDGINC